MLSGMRPRLQETLVGLLLHSMQVYMVSTFVYVLNGVVRGGVRLG